MPSSLSTPACVVRLPTAERNAKKMLDKCKKLDLNFRPHVKTHKTLEGALLQTGGKRSTIIVSTLQELDFYVNRHNFTDVIYAIPFPVSKVKSEILQPFLFSKSSKEVLPDKGESSSSPKRRKKDEVNNTEQQKTPEEKVVHFLIDHVQQAEFLVKKAKITKKLSVYVMVGGRSSTASQQEASSKRKSGSTVAAKKPNQDHLEQQHQPLQMHQAGLNPEGEEALDLMRFLLANPKSFTLHGIYIHAAPAYSCQTQKECVEAFVEEATTAVEFAKRVYETCDQFEFPEITIGSTPSCSFEIPNRYLPLQGKTFLPTAISRINPNYKPKVFKLTELHCGNYLFFDQMQADLIKSCDISDVACFVKATVISIYEEKLLIDCGWTGMSAQGAEVNYGRILSHPELKIKSLKQETGEVVVKDEEGGGKKAPRSMKINLAAKYPVGTVITIAPFHSCAACHQYRSLVVEDAKENIVATWERCSGHG
ncbi:unnamed protein product [Amoebophrya sp. A120]|nr:unnamed protein product [Amoebophrya sp. A120]|eukprot:GSA120T00021963001.1